MLVLSRKLDQAIVIQGNIAIKILDISGDRVKIGITAPRNVVILREELAEESANDALASARQVLTPMPMLRRVAAGA